MLTERVKNQLKKERFSRLLMRGYFPKEMIPAFRTTDLGQELVLNSLMKYLKNSYGSKRTKTVVYSIPKIKHFRRNLGIPNPMPFCMLSYTIAEKWDEIIEPTSNSKFSMSPLNWDDSERRAIKDPDFKSFTMERLLRATSYRYAVHLDISRFYASIYTHSIPWAIHTKAIAKSNTTNSLFGNILDKASREMQDGQTIGIITGPDTSRIISEVIASEIDSVISKKFGTLEGIRFVDDYIFFGDDLNILEQVQALLQKTLKEYELELNSEKIQVHHLPFEYTDMWISQLKKFTIRKLTNNQKNDLIAYFSLAFMLSKKYETEHILPYAISRLKKVWIRPDNIILFQTLLIQAMFAEPKTISYISHILLSYATEQNTIDKKQLKSYLTKFIEQQIKVQNIHEISWALWLCKSLKIKLATPITRLIVTIDNPIIALIALDMRSKNLLPSSVSFSLWGEKMNKDHLYTEHWLLAYEAHIQGWLKPSATYIDRDPFFKILKKYRVSFYNSTNELTEEHLEDMDAVSSIPFSLRKIRAKNREAFSNNIRRNSPLLNIEGLEDLFDD